MKDTGWSVLGYGTLARTGTLIDNAKSLYRTENTRKCKYRIVGRMKDVGMARRIKDIGREAKEEEGREG